MYLHESFPKRRGRSVVGLVLIVLVWLLLVGGLLTLALLVGR